MPEAISIVVCVGFLTGGLRLAAILVSGLQVLVRGAALRLGEIAGQCSAADSCSPGAAPPAAPEWPESLRL